VTGGVLATWDTAAWPDGDYELRLSVLDTLGLTGTVQVRVVVDNVAPYFDETTPARVTAAAGGDVYTTNAELHLYIPPQGFAEDAVVTVQPVVEAPPALAGASPLGVAYELAWNGARLTKPVTLECSRAGVNLGGTGGVAAIYRSSDGLHWERLGGTVADGHVSLAISMAGRYALYGDNGGPGGAGGLGTLTFTPRVFSPTGGFATTQLAIGFTLGRAGPVTVRVYNHAGRLVRELVAGQTMGAGANLVRWDGRDRGGVLVEDGLYVVTVQALGSTMRKPLAVVH